MLSNTFVQRHKRQRSVAVGRLGLARAYVLQGDLAQARSAYQGFFAQWKDANAGIPVLNQAVVEYAKLK